MSSHIEYISYRPRPSYSCRQSPVIGKKTAIIVIVAVVEVPAAVVVVVVVILPFRMHVHDLNLNKAFIHSVCLLPLNRGGRQSFN